MINLQSVRQQYRDWCVNCNGMRQERENANIMQEQIAKMFTTLHDGKLVAAYTALNGIEPATILKKIWNAIHCGRYFPPKRVKQYSSHMQ